MATWVSPSSGDGRVTFKPLDSQRDQLGIADLQLASFPTGDGIARYAQCPAELGLAQAEGLATSAEIYGAHSACVAHYTPRINLTGRRPRRGLWGGVQREVRPRIFEEFTTTAVRCRPPGKHRRPFLLSRKAALLCGWWCDPFSPNC